MNAAREQPTAVAHLEAAAEHAPGAPSRELEGWLDGHPVPDADQVVKAIRQVAALRTEAAADLLNRAASADTFSGLRGPDGEELRAFALEQLLGLGFPLALRVSPEALEQGKRRPSLSGLSLVGLLLGGTGVALELTRWNLHPAFGNGALGLAITGLVLSVVAAFGPKIFRAVSTLGLGLYGAFLGFASLEMTPDLTIEGVPISALFLGSFACQLAALLMLSRGGEDSPP
jgi:hypothetical protein